MFLGPAHMRPFVLDRADDARLAVFPLHRPDASDVAQPRPHAVGGHQQPRAQRHAVGKMHQGLLRAPLKAGNAHAFDDVDAEFGCAAPQSGVKVTIGNHVSEGLAGRHLTVEGQEYRTHRVCRA